MQAIINFHPITEKMPDSGQFLVRVHLPEDTNLLGLSFPTIFTEVVWGDPLGPMDRFGELYDYQEYVTHWALLPESINEN